MEKYPDSKMRVIEDGKMYHQGKRDVTRIHQEFSNGLESDVINVETTTQESYKNRVK